MGLVNALDYFAEVDVPNFSEAMSDLHTDLAERPYESEDHNRVRTCIFDMTHADATNRKPMAIITPILCSMPHLCCDGCFIPPEPQPLMSEEPQNPTAPVVNQWIWSKEYQRYYYPTVGDDGTLTTASARFRQS